MLARIVRSVLLLSLCASHGLATENLEHLLLFDSGQDGYGRYRIPSLVLTPAGTLLAICEGRKAGGGLTGDIDLVCRRSRDGGKTWLPMTVVADDDAHTLGNPCLVVDAATRKVWLAFTRSLGSDTEEQIVAGMSRDSTRVLITSTDDDGTHWSTPVDITATVKQPDWTWYGTGPGIGIQLKSGRLVIPAYHAQLHTKVYRSHMAFSDDHGQTWKHGAAVGEHCGECHVIAAADGSLHLNARTNEGRERRTVARSLDGGETWSAATFDEQLYDPHCEACVIALPALAGQAPRWLFTHPAGEGRRNLTARVSLDEGRTWPISKRLREGDSQYSCLALLTDGTIGCLYDCWSNGNYRLYFTRFSVPQR